MPSLTSITIIGEQVCALYIYLYESRMTYMQDEQRGNQLLHFPLLLEASSYMPHLSLFLSASLQVLGAHLCQRGSQGRVMSPAAAPTVLTMPPNQSCVATNC